MASAKIIVVDGVDLETEFIEPSVEHQGLTRTELDKLKQELLSIIQNIDKVDEMVSQDETNHQLNLRLTKALNYTRSPAKIAEIINNIAIAYEAEGDLFTFVNTYFDELKFDDIEQLEGDYLDVAEEMKRASDINEFKNFYRDYVIGLDDWTEDKYYGHRVYNLTKEGICYEGLIRSLISDHKTMTSEQKESNAYDEPISIVNRLIVCHLIAICRFLIHFPEDSKYSDYYSYYDALCETE